MTRPPRSTSKPGRRRQVLGLGPDGPATAADLLDLASLPLDDRSESPEIGAHHAEPPEAWWGTSSSGGRSSDAFGVAPACARRDCSSRLRKPPLDDVPHARPLTMPLHPQRRRRHLQEVLEDAVAGVGADRLGVELDPDHGVLAVAQRHDHPVVGAGGDLQGRGQGRGLDHQRVVPGGREGVGHPGEEPGAVVADLAQLPVHQRRRAHHPATVRLPDGLVPQAHPEDGDARAELADQLHRDPGVGGASWARARPPPPPAGAPRSPPPWRCHCAPPRSAPPARPAAGPG